MLLNELIEMAKEATGSYGQLAEKLDCHQNRITDWKKGTRIPDAGKIACMAEAAGLPVLQTVAEIESQLDGRFADVWRNALGKLTAAGVTAGAVGILLISPAKQSEAATVSNLTEVAKHCILCKLLGRLAQKWVSRRFSRRPIQAAC